MAITNTSKDPHPEWVMGGNPNAIEAQEAYGQRELIKSSQLPVKGSYGKDALPDYKRLGIKVVGKIEGDDLFVDVKLPAGWKIEPTDHSMWRS